jgi:hypothetical protein
MRLFADQIALGLQPDPHEAIGIGVDLLVNGSDGTAVVALAFTSTGSSLA